MPFKTIGFSGKPWPQFTEEIEGLLAIFAREGVRSYLEVGCRYGDTFHTVGLALPEGSRCVAADLPAAKNGKRIKRHLDSGTYLHRAAADLRRKGHSATVIIGDSHHPKTVEAVRALGPFDAVFIDGDHTYEGVKADWRNYGPMGRIVAFHDLKGEKSASYGPRQLFGELAGHHRNEVISVDPYSCGIGVVWRP